MGLKHQDLVDNVLSKISIDEFEPKTGDITDVIVVGFAVKDEMAGEDLYDFINSSRVEINDVEVSPNPNQEDYYIVFVEIPRDDNFWKTFKNLIHDVKNVTGRLAWKATTHLTDDYIPLGDKRLKQYVITDPENYMSRDEWEEKQNAVPEQGIMEFLQNSDLSSVTIRENRVTLKRGHVEAEFEIVGFGNAERVFEKLRINESAIRHTDSTFRTFNKMLGSMAAVSIDDYVVIYDPAKSDALVTKLC